LPRFCHPIYLTGEPLLIQDSKGFPVASTVDVEHADFGDVRPGHAKLAPKLNEYAENLLKHAISQSGLLTTFCMFGSNNRTDNFNGC